MRRSRLTAVACLILAIAGPCGAGLLGDADGDGRLDIGDALLVLRAAVGIASPNDAGRSGIDVDGDGQVTVADALLLLHWIVEGAPPPDLDKSAWIPMAAGPTSPVYSLLWDRAGRLWAASPGQGVFRSPDGGKAWLPSLLADDLPESLLQSPSDPSVFLAGTDKGIFRSDDGGDRWSRLSAADGGPIFTIHALAEDASRPGCLYAVGDGVLRSDDGGRTWRYLPIDLDPLEDVHAVATDPFHAGGVLIGTRRGRILRSDDEGETWTESINGLGGAGYRVFTIVPDPHRAGRWYLGSCNGGFWRSDDGGQTWEKAGGITMPPNVNALLTDAWVSGRLYAGTSAGPVLSDDYGDTWRPLGQGLEGIEVLSLIRGGTDGTLYAGMWTADVGVQRLP